MSEMPMPSARVNNDIVALMPTLRAFARRFAKTDTDVNDLVQESICRALASIDQFKTGTSLQSWMFTITRNRFCTNYAQRTRESCGSVTDVACYEIAALPSHDWVMRSGDVEKALKKIGNAEREAILLVAAEIFYEEAAISCHCKLGTIKSRVSRGRLHLANLLGDDTVVSASSLS